MKNEIDHRTMGSGLLRDNPRTETRAACSQESGWSAAPVSSAGATLIEAVLVILIVGVLAASAVPIMRDCVEKAEWSEAHSAAASIRRAIRAYIAKNGPTYSYSGLVGTLDAQSIHQALGFSSSDLDGKYLNQEDYSITSVTADPPTCAISVTSTKTGGPSGTGTIDTSGDWSVQ